MKAGYDNYGDGRYLYKATVDDGTARSYSRS